MIGKVLLLALLVAVASSSPLTLDTSTVNYGDAVETFLQAWKQMIPCGYAADNIPVMDPLTTDFSSFSYVKGNNNIVGNVSNIRISGLDNFLVLSGSYDATTQHSTFDVLFPEIQILGSYAMEGTIEMMGFAIPLRQVSLLNERFEQLRFVGDYTFAPSLTNANGLRVSEFHLQFYLAGVLIDNWDTLWNISLNNLANKWGQEIVAVIAQQIQPDVDQLLATYVMPGVNNLLSNYSLTQVTNWFVDTANEWNSANCEVQA